MTAFPLLAAAAAAFLLSALACAAARRLALRFDWLDRPGGHKGHARPVPLGGGLAMAFSFDLAVMAGAMLIAPPNGSRPPAKQPINIAENTIANHAIAGSTIDDSTIAENAIAERTIDEVTIAKATTIEKTTEAWAGRRAHMLAILLGGAALVVLGFLDDRGGLDWKLRLAVQTATAGVVSIWLVPSGDPLARGAFVFWAVGLVNAFNMLDNMDALSAGAAALVALGLAVAPLAAGVSPPPHAACLLAASLGGAAAGFLVHNAPPARLYMGDAGAYLLGFVLASAAVEAAPLRAAPAAAGWLLVGLFALPWYDLATVAALRLLEGRSPFRGDQCHLSHRLVARGLSRPAAVGAILLAAALVAAVGGGVFVAGAADYRLLCAALVALALLGALDVGFFLRGRAAERRAASSSAD